MKPERRHRSLFAALLLSVVVHVCVLVWPSAPPKSSPAPIAHAPATIELNFIDVPPPVLTPVEHEKIVDAKQNPPIARRVEEPPRENDDAANDSNAEELAADEGASKTGGKHELAHAASNSDDEREVAADALASKSIPATDGVDEKNPDALVALTPTALPDDFVLPDPEPISRGKTVRNRPDELPDALTLKLIEEERVRGRVNGHVTDMAAIAKVESGGGSVYATELREVLKKAAEKPPPFDQRSSTVGRLVSQYKDGAAKFGATGSPYDVAASPYDGRSQSIAGKEVDPVRARSATDAAAYHGLNQEMQKGAAFRSFAEGAMSQGVVAIVELVQDPNAKLVSVQLIQASGSPAFDKFVLELAPKSVESMKPFAPGSHPRGLRTWWEFRGVISYTRSTKEMNLKDDGWYLAAMLPAGLLAGSFEETTGDVYVIDVRNPQYKCRVKLLRVYE